jgi:hypothetical protein
MNKLNSILLFLFKQTVGGEQVELAPPSNGQRLHRPTDTTTTATTTTTTTTTNKTTTTATAFDP